MERARRQAAGPMRVIMEASKSKRRVQEAEAPETPDTVRRIAVRPAGAAAETAVIATRSFVPTSVQATTPAVAAAPLPAPASATPAPASPVAPPPVAGNGSGNGEGITTEITLTADDLQRRAANVATPALEAVGRASAVLPLPKTAAALPELQNVPPKIVSMVEPVVTPALLDGVRRDTGVTAELTIRADGTVAHVNVLPPASRQLVRAMVAALEQWRFEPLAGERLHRVQLVFND